MTMAEWSTYSKSTLDADSSFGNLFAQPILYIPVYIPVYIPYTYMQVFISVKLTFCFGFQRLCLYLPFAENGKKVNLIQYSQQQQRQALVYNSFHCCCCFYCCLLAFYGFLRRASVIVFKKKKKFCEILLTNFIRTCTRAWRVCEAWHLVANCSELR